jgi:alpha,alpha-trehalose phosphorylase
MRDDGMLSFWPRRAPEENAILRFPVMYRGQMLEVEIGQENVEYTLLQGESLVIRMKRKKFS